MEFDDLIKIFANHLEQAKFVLFYTKSDSQLFYILKSLS